MEEDFLKHVSGKAVAKSPPKSKAKLQPEPAKAKAAGKTKRADADDEPAPKKAKAEPKGKKATADANNALSAPIVQKNNSTGSISVDTHCGYRNAGGKVHADFGITLNQTNIDQNNNKFYIIQLINTGSGFALYTRYGRVGETGVKEAKDGLDEVAGIKAFQAKFKDKTGNNWDSRDNFVIKNQKYQIVETASETDAEKVSTVAVSKPKAAVPEPPSKLDDKTQSLVNWILNEDMFKSSMAAMDIDVNKCPLGAITKDQVARGFAVLKDIDAALQANMTASLSSLSSQFYTLIPHSFSRSQRPPVIDSQELLRQKFDLVAMMGDIEIAQALQKGSKTGVNATDEKYEQLNATLTPLKPSDKVFKVISAFMSATEGYRKLTILDVWSTDRHSEGARFETHAKLDNRRLLWHGTNIAVVAAILKTGLRIMPTASSGSRVGRGIYLASEVGKSAGYCRTASVGGKQQGILFLCEAAMGKIKQITQDDGSLVAAPPGFDSVLAKGTQEPDEKLDTVIELDKKKVLVPQGKPIPTGISSSFSQSEYLVYKESQCRLRYILRVQF